tara:strand:- start:7187 stop:7423 length:237 start_codon:yes stop_codon:yes gene_type:complete
MSNTSPGFIARPAGFKVAFTVEYHLDDGVCDTQLNTYIEELPALDRVKVLKSLVSKIDEAISDEEFVLGLAKLRELTE